MSETPGIHVANGLFLTAQKDEVKVDLSLWRDELRSEMLAEIRKVATSMRRSVADAAIIDDGKSLVLWVKVECKKVHDKLIRALLSDLVRIVGVFG